MSKYSDPAYYAAKRAEVQRVKNKEFKLFAWALTKEAIVIILIGIPALYWIITGLRDAVINARVMEKF